MTAARLPSLDLSDVRRRLFPRRSALWVNQGRCFAWALAAYDQHRALRPRLCTVSGWGGHAFLQVGLRFYDAAFPRGVDDWRDLWRGAFTPPLGALRHQSRARFVAYWRRMGRDPAAVRALPTVARRRAA